MRKLSMGLVLATVLSCNATQSRSVILFLGDGMGLATVNAAGIHGYGKPATLYIQNMPFIGLSETSSASSWVSDSAAGMTAIVTGRKTHNGVISQSSDAERGVRDGTPLKTILEYAEEHGLSTGVVSNSSVADATPAACYAHSNDRSKHGEIFAQVFKPRFGDGVDVVIGAGRQSIVQATSALGLNLEAELQMKQYTFISGPEEFGALLPHTRRLVALFEGEEFDLSAAVDLAIRILAGNPRGFFLMVESNNHFTDVQKTLDRTVQFDRLVRRVAEERRENTLILVTADHSYDLRLPRGRKEEGIVPLVKVEGSHTAEEVLIAAEGPGAESVRGIIPNTRIFGIMMAALGWQESSSP